MNNHKGFTLIEVMIGVALTGIVATFAMVGFGMVTSMQSLLTAAAESRTEANSLGNQISKYYNTRLSEDGIALSEPRGDYYAKFDIDTPINGINDSEIEQYVLSNYCRSTGQQVIFPESCGLTCPEGEAPTVQVEIESTQRPGIIKRVYPNNGDWHDANAVAATVCAKDAGANVIFKLNFFHMNKSRPTLQTRVLTLQKELLTNSGARLVPVP